MFRVMILLTAGLTTASGAFAAAVPAPRGGTGGFSRSMPVGAPRPPSPQPRGGPGTLGGYLQRPPSVHGNRGGYYPGGYYPGRYYAPYYYPYYYDSSYYAPAYAPAYSYYPAPNAVYLDSPSGEAQPYQPYSQPQAGQPQARPAPSRGQYYCPDTGYYPTVQACPKGWLRVVPDGPPPQ